RLPAIYRLFAKIPDMVGHSGASGAVLYYIPKLDLYISGTVNQIKKHSLPYQAMVQMVMAFMKALK
ncbi:MAG: serine hydrolase, partial [Gammaproteobacteria bacterium]|nr:serine hydrolase [Gammaproteobacteria bacterium]